MDFKRRVEYRIMEAGCWWFLRNGFHGSSLEDILQTAQAAKSSFYLHFGSKKGLLADCLIYNHTRFMNEWRDAKIDNIEDNATRHIMQLFESRIQREFRDDFSGSIFVQMQQEFAGKWVSRCDPVQEAIRMHHNDVKKKLKGNLKYIGPFTEVEAEEKTDFIYFLYEGAGIDAVIRRDFEPLRRAMKIVREQVLCT